MVSAAYKPADEGNDGPCQTTEGKMIPLRSPGDKQKWLPSYSHVSSGSTNVWVLETEPLEDRSVHEVKIFLRDGTANMAALGAVREAVIAGYRQLSAWGSSTAAVKQWPQWEDREPVKFEPISESFWIFVGEARTRFEEIVPHDVRVYTLSDGAFVLDAIFDGGRAACILRKRYAHIMVLVGDKMADVVLRDDDATPAKIQDELRAALA